MGEKKISSRILSIFVLKGIGAGLLFLMHTILARSIGAESYGAISLGWTFAIIFAGIALLGLPNAAIRFIPEYIAKSQEGQIGCFMRFSFTVALILAGLAALGIDWIADSVLVKSELRISFEIAALMVVPVGLVSLTSKILQGYNRTALSVIPENIIVPTVMLLSLFFLLFRSLT